MSFRQSIRPIPSSGAFSTTSTTLATLTIPALTGRRIYITGFSIVYATAPGTATAPTISNSDGVVYQIGTAILTNTAAVFPFPIMTDVNKAAKLSATLTAAGVINLSLLYFYDQ